MLNYKLVEGSQSEKPSSFEIVATTVYFRKNIERITRVDEINNTKVELWQYEEATLSVEEYEKYKVEQGVLDTAINTEYLVCLADIGL